MRSDRVAIGAAGGEVAAFNPALVWEGEAGTRGSEGGEGFWAAGKEGSDTADSRGAWIWGADSIPGAAVVEFAGGAAWGLTASYRAVETGV